MSDPDAAGSFPAERDFEDHRTGKKFGYGHWLQPMINSNDGPTANEEEQAIAGETSRDPASARRGRGRPRVTKPRNDSAVEV